MSARACALACLCVCVSFCTVHAYKMPSQYVLQMCVYQCETNIQEELYK